MGGVSNYQGVNMEYRNKNHYDRLVKQACEKLKERYDNVKPRINYSSVLKGYRGLNVKYKFSCEKHGDFEDYLYRALPGPRMSHVLCPKCRLEKKEERKLLVKEARDERRHDKIRKLMDNIKDMEPFDKDKETYSEYMVRKFSLMFKDKPYDFSNSVYSGSDTPMEITCKLHGKFYRTPHSLYKASGCPKCNEDNRYAVLRYSKEEIQKYIDEKYNGMYKIVDDSFTIASNDFKVKCKKHGEFNTTWRTLKVSGCRKCFAESMKFTLKDLLRRSLKLFGNKYDYSKTELNGSRNSITIICPKHGEFEKVLGEHLKGQGCPVCSASLGERAAYEIFMELGINVSREYKIKGHSFRYDFLLKNSELIIEIDGDQHRGFTFYVSPEETMKRDKEKEELANKNGFTIVRIPVKGHQREEVVKHTILNSLKKLKISEKDFKSEKDYRNFIVANSK